VGKRFMVLKIKKGANGDLKNFEEKF